MWIEEYEEEYVFFSVSDEKFTIFLQYVSNGNFEHYYFTFPLFLGRGIISILERSAEIQRF